MKGVQHREQLQQLLHSEDTVSTVIPDDHLDDLEDENQSAIELLGKSYVMIAYRLFLPNRQDSKELKIMLLALFSANIRMAMSHHILQSALIASLGLI